MHACTMRTEFNCQSAIRVKNAIVFYYVHTIAISANGLFCPFCYVKVALPELLKEPHHAASSWLNFPTFLRDLLARGNLYTVACRASGLAAKWCWLHYDEAQGAVFCFCGIATYVLMVTF